MPFTAILNAFIGRFIDATGLLTPVALGLLTFFLAIEFMLVGIYYAMHQEIDVKPLLSKVITTNVLMWVILNWAWLTKQLVNIWVGWGLRSSQGVMLVKDFTDPDNIAKFGFAATGVIFQHLSQYSGWEQIKNLLEVWLSGGVALLVILFYFTLAAWAMVSLLEFYMGAAATTILLPLGVSGLFSFVPERAIGHMICGGVRLFTLALILAIALPLMIELQLRAPTNFAIPLIGPNFVQALYSLAGAIALGALCWRAGAFSAGLMGGYSWTSPRDMTQHVQNLITHATRVGNALDAINDKLGMGATPGRRI